MRRLLIMVLLAASCSLGAHAVASAQETIPYDPGTTPSNSTGTGTGTGTGLGVGGASAANSGVGGISASRLPYTGTDDMNLYVGAGIVLVLVGSALLIANARRHRTQPRWTTG